MALDPIIARGVQPVGEGWANTLMGLERLSADRQQNALARDALAQRQSEFQYGREQDRNALAQSAQQQKAQEEARVMLARLRAGDPSAAQEFVRDFSPQFPELAAFAQQSPDKIGQVAEQVFAGFLGEKSGGHPYAIDTQEGPFGSKILSDGERFQVIEPPKAPVATQTEMPSSIREWQEYQKMKPEEQRAFLALRRSNSTPEAAEELSRAKAIGTATGKAEGEARSELPTSEMNAGNMLDVLKQFKGNKGTRFLFGGYSVAPVVPGTPQADASAIYDQILGKAFLQAFETLKGGGQITEVEGAKATAAITRLQNRRQSYGSALKAVEELESIVTRAIENSRKKAYASKGPATRNGAAAAPAVEDPLGIRQ